MSEFSLYMLAAVLGLLAFLIPAGMLVGILVDDRRAARQEADK